MAVDLTPADPRPRGVVKRPRALLLTPTWPSRGGNGLAMRAGLLLDALANNHRVDLWCIPIAGGAPDEDIEPRIDRQVEAELDFDPGWQLAHRAGPDALRRLGRPSTCRFTVSRALTALRGELGLPDYACTVVLRSYLLPFASPLDRAGGKLGLRVLDLDDDEAMTHRRLADLALTSDWPNRQRLGEAHHLEVELYETFEAMAVPWADRLLTAQRAHAERLGIRFQHLDVGVLPNAVEVPEHLDRGLRPPSAEPRLIFVGNLGYAPNVAAARELALLILPVLERRGLRPRLRLVGRRPAQAVEDLAQRPAVEIFPDAPALEEHYAWADQAVLPLRAGGGTRIKILEAFAAGVPVVSTRLGAEGLDLTNGRELLLGTSIDELADHVEHLAHAPDRAFAIAQLAHDWTRRHHQRQQVVQNLAARLLSPVESFQPAAPLQPTSPVG